MKNNTKSIKKTSTKKGGLNKSSIQSHLDALTEAIEKGQKTIDDSKLSAGGNGDLYQPKLVLEYISRVGSCGTGFFGKNTGCERIKLREYTKLKEFIEANRGKFNEDGLSELIEALGKKINTREKYSNKALMGKYELESKNKIWGGKKIVIKKKTPTKKPVKKSTTKKSPPKKKPTTKPKTVTKKSKTMSDYKKDDLVKIAKRKDVSLIGRDKKPKSKEQLYRSLKYHKCI